MQTPTPIEPRATTPHELDWEAVEPVDAPVERDVLGLTHEDRAALGLTAARPVDVVAALHGDANEALREAILAGASYAKTRRE